VEYRAFRGVAARNQRDFARDTRVFGTGSLTNEEVNMSQFIIALAAALAILTTVGATTTQASHHPVTAKPADVTLPEPF
jgi:hypothetical protein